MLSETRDGSTLLCREEIPMLLSKCVIALLFVSSLAAQDAPWLGAWKLSTAPDIATAIERCTQEMSFIKRPIARSRLKKLNPAYQRIVLARSGDAFAIQFEDRQPIRIPVDGKAIPWIREDGEKFLVSVKPGPDALVQHYQGEDGERSNRFILDATGKSLTLEVTVKSQKLPQPLVYALVYIR